MTYSPFRHLDSILWKRKPIQFTFFLTRRCNAKCPFCFYISKQNEAVSASSELSIDEIERIAPQLGKLLWLAFSGGEIFLRSDLVEIKKLNPNPKVKILAKVEYFNPRGSIKDRAALFMIKAGEKSGELTPNKTVIEATSGNTGIGLALVCSVKEYKLLLIMSESVTIERQKILKARGAEILFTPSHLGTDGAIEEAYRLVRENPEIYFMTDQFNNAANWQAHYYGTAEEIWNQTTGKVTMVVDTMGTTGTVMGISKRLKE